MYFEIILSIELFQSLSTVQRWEFCSNHLTVSLIPEAKGIEGKKSGTNFLIFELSKTALTPLSPKRLPTASGKQREIKSDYLSILILCLSILILYLYQKLIFLYFHQAGFHREFFALIITSNLLFFITILYHKTLYITSF